jgi:ribosome modulation factor
MSHARVTLKQAFERGRSDARHRKNRNECPYRDPVAATQWERGLEHEYKIRRQRRR